VRRKLIDLLLLLVRVGRAVQSLSPEGIRKETEQGVWPAEVGW
jgi:hypothetical protein